MIDELVRGETAPRPWSSNGCEPIEVIRLPQTDGERVARRRAAEVGADALAAGEVGVILVAGGAGTRLGFDGPKGTFPIGPVSQASLFQIHAEKIVALGRRHGKALPLYVMTSPENHEATVDVLRGPRPFRPGPRPVLRSGADAGGGSSHRGSSCWPRKDQHRPQP